MSSRIATAVKWSFRLLFAAVFLVLVYFAYVAWEVRHYARIDQARNADAIVVLGAAQYNGVPSPVLKARLDHAAALWKKGNAPYIVVTGGKAPGDSSTEAGASATYLGTLGVPDSRVLREVQGRNSWQSLQAAARFMQSRDINSVVLVSDSFHDARIREMSQDLGLKAYVSPTLTSPIKGSTREKYLAKEVVALAFGKAVGFNHLAGLEKNFNANS